jgi:hypothetical protein
MNRPQFFHLGSTESLARLAEWVDAEIDTEKVVCPVNDGHQRGGKRLTNLSVSLPGHTIEGFVWTWYSECLLTDRVLELFKSSGFTGFEVKQVKARYKRSTEVPPRLWELVVTGWAGVAPPKSGIKLIEDCPVCGHKAYSAPTNLARLINPSQWDGSDFFMVWPLPKYIFTTDRVAQVIRANRVAGAVLSRPEDLSFSPDDTIGGGRLSYWMPEERARELGEPLGIY